MDTRDFTELRKKSRMTQAAVASALGVTSRTIYGWECATPPRTLSRLEARAVRELFAPTVIAAQLVDMTERAFAEIPSELVAIWIVEHQDCILFPAGIRYQDLGHNKRSDVVSPQCVSPLVVESLTTYPLRTGEIVNLAGDAILRHSAKKYKQTRAATHFQEGMCESLLHVPAFAPSARGPMPVLLLSLENKLDSHGRVILPPADQAPVDDEKETAIAKHLATESKERLNTDLRLLEMIGDDDA